MRTRLNSRRGWAVVVLALLELAISAGCAHRIPEARTEPEPPRQPREERAAESMDNDPCSPYWGWLFPGVAQFCMGKPVEGTTLTTLTAGEIATLVYLNQPETRRRLGAHTTDPGLLLTATSLQKLVFYNLSDIYIEADLAHERRFAPKESMGELVAAPFNPRVLKSPQVWPYIFVGATLGALQVAALQPGKRPPERRVLGRRLPPEYAYPAHFGTSGFLNLHVALAEESLFRGLLQSHFARNMGETSGLMLSSALFGLWHAPNAALYDDPQQQVTALAVGVPLRAIMGVALGHTYSKSGYRLSRPVATHFWWNVISLGANFIGGGQNQLGLRVSFPF